MKNKKIEEKKGFWRRAYGEAGSYLGESRNYFWAVAAIFAVFAVAGFLYPIFFVDEIKEFLKKLATETEGFNMLQMIVYILKNNLSSAFFSLFLGILLGIFPVLLAVANAYLLGFVSNAVVAEAGYLSLWKLLPHGVFEIPAIIISIGLGIKLGMFLFTKHPKEEFLKRLDKSMKTFVFVVVPLLVIAAIIEGSLIVLLG